MISVSSIFSDNGFDITDIPDQQTYVKMQCEWYNKSAGKLDGIDCRICRNKGYIAKVDKTGDFALSECSCMKKRRTLWGMKASGLGELLDKSSFEKYEVKEAWHDKMKKSALHYAANHRESWFYLAGQSGSGKTMLCTAICKELINQGFNVCYMLWDKISQKLDAYRYKEALYDSFICEIKDAEVLYIDDFLKTDQGTDGIPLRPSSSELKKAYTVINERYLARKITLISSEHYITEIASYDSATGGRIKEMSGDYTLSIKRDEKRNYRLYGGN